MTPSLVAALHTAHGAGPLAADPALLQTLVQALYALAPATAAWHPPLFRRFVPVRPGDTGVADRAGLAREAQAYLAHLTAYCGYGLGPGGGRKRSGSVGGDADDGPGKAPRTDAAT